ncbi:hypothetical protein ABBQ32_008927, partial [Trebouxia sp. C0010 RCD-2024]
AISALLTCAASSCEDPVTVPLDPAGFYAFNVSNMGQQEAWVALTYTAHPSTSQACATLKPAPPAVTWRPLYDRLPPVDTPAVAIQDIFSASFSTLGSFGLSKQCQLRVSPA